MADTNLSDIQARLLQAVEQRFPRGTLTAAQLAKISAAAIHVSQEYSRLGGNLEEYLHREENMLVDTFEREAEFQRHQQELEAKAKAEKEKWEQHGGSLTPAEQARVLELDKELAGLVSAKVLLDKVADEKTANLDNAFAQTFPGFNKKFSETSADELRLLFDDLEEVERKKKAKDLQPHVEDALLAYKDQLSNMEGQAERIVEKGKIVHKLQSNTLKGQITEARRILSSGKGTPQLDEHVEVAMDIQEKIEHYEAKVATCEEKLEVIKEVQLDREIEQEVKTIELVTKEEKVALIDAKDAAIDSEMLEMCHEVFGGVYGIEGKTPQEYYTKVAQAMKEGKIPVGDEDAQAIFQELESTYRVDGKSQPLAEMNAKSSEKKDYKEEARNLASSFVQQPGIQPISPGWRNILSDNPPAPDKGNNRGR